jgi:XTP/dITP diphosphohydrolase
MELVFATHNKNKFKEVQLLLPKHITLRSLDDIGCFDEIPETADSIEHYGYACFADDTGLLVDALNGAPGVYSARYAGEGKSSEDNMDKLLREMEGETNREACFKTTIALHLEREKILFNGIALGEITEEKFGEGGFGYDPIFKPKGYDKTFAELPLTVKNEISHRGKAMKQLIGFLKNLE